MSMAATAPPPIMFRLLFIACFLASASARGIIFRNGRLRGGFLQHHGDASVNRLPADQWFVQKLDHFNDADTRTWSQRYGVNDSYYLPGGPVFVQIGGEGPATAQWLVKGQWITWAREFNALCLQLEHRYYGQSHPTEDLSVKNLQYLSSEQALADLASFRSAMAEKYRAQTSKWIFFGGSYSGSLAAWMRLKYPHLVNGAVASSAPLLAQINFPEFLGVVENSIAQVSNSCNSAIAESVSQIEGELETKEGCDRLSQKFKLCLPLNASVEDDVTNLYSVLAGNFEGVVQYNRDNRISGFANNVTIDTICDIMADESLGTEIDRYAAVNSLLMDTYDQDCLDYEYKSMIDDLRNSSWNSDEAEGGRQWTYQTCTEFGFFQSSDLHDQPFGNKFPLDFFVKQCADVYGPKFNYSLLSVGVNQTNIIYGGLGLQVTKVIFPNGSVDPWHKLGTIVDLNPEAKALYIQGTAHCADMYPDSPNDSTELVNAREIIRQQIAAWLS